MNTQTIFQVGNSHAISLPKPLMKELNLKPGQKVTVERLSNSDQIIITAEKPKKKKKEFTKKEFEAWLDQFIEEDGELLDELASR